MAKLVVIIQCDIVQKKCVGYACMKSFYERSGRFTGYDADTKYMTITCGGCCGAGVAGKIEDLNRKQGCCGTFSIVRRIRQLSPSALST